MKYLSGLSSKLMLTAFVCASGLSSMASTASAQWGSIAFDETTFQYGYRVASPTQADAESGAMGWCRNGGSTNCRVVYSFTGGTCGTLAVSENRRFWFRQNDQGTRPQQIAFTQAASVAQCAQAGGVRCAPQVTICSDQPAAIVDQRQGAVSSAVLNFAASNLGQQVGNGQC